MLGNRQCTKDLRNGKCFGEVGLNCSINIDQWAHSTEGHKENNDEAPCRPRRNCKDTNWSYI